MLAAGEVLELADQQPSVAHGAGLPAAGSTADGDLVGTVQGTQELGDPGVAGGVGLPGTVGGDDVGQLRCRVFPEA